MMHQRVVERRSEQYITNIFDPQVRLIWGRLLQATTTQHSTPRQLLQQLDGNIGNGTEATPSGGVPGRAADRVSEDGRGRATSEQVSYGDGDAVGPGGAHRQPQQDAAQPEGVRQASQIDEQAGIPRNALDEGEPTRGEAPQAMQGDAPVQRSQIDSEPPLEQEQGMGLDEPLRAPQGGGRPPRRPRRRAEKIAQKTAVRVATLNINGFGTLLPDHIDNKWGR